MRVAKWNLVEFNPNSLEQWVMETFEKQDNEGPYGDGHVTLGLSFNLYFLGQHVTTDIFQKAKSLGVQTMASHYTEGIIKFNPSLPQTLLSYGLLDESILQSHANKCSAKDAELVRKGTAHISSTPSTELQMAMGSPECYREDLQSHASLGVDCHSNNLGSIVSEMRLGLQAARAHSHVKLEALSKTPKRVSKAVEEAFNLGTIQGAEPSAWETR
jgi:hypothetical protein